MLTGVVEVGLFCHMAQAAYFGNVVRFSPFLLPAWNIPPDYQHLSVGRELNREMGRWSPRTTGQRCQGVVKHPNYNTTATIVIACRRVETSLYPSICTQLDFFTHFSTTEHLVNGRSRSGYQSRSVLVVLHPPTATYILAALIYQNSNLPLHLFRPPRCVNGLRERLRWRRPSRLRSTNTVLRSSSSRYLAWTVMPSGKSQPSPLVIA